MISPGLGWLSVGVPVLRYSQAGSATTKAAGKSNHDQLDLIEAELVAPAIEELRRARRGVVRHRRGLFQRLAVLELGRDPRRPETVVAELGGDPGTGRAPADHRIGVRLRQHGARELAGAAADRAEQRALGIAAQLGAVEIAGKIFLEVVMAWHRVPLATLLAQPHP